MEFCINCHGSQPNVMRSTSDTVDSDKLGRLPYVFADRIRCPACGSAQIKTVKSMPVEIDGSRSRYSKCLHCDGRFIVVIE